jgi:hypothetical protein
MRNSCMCSLYLWEYLLLKSFVSSADIERVINKKEKKSRDTWNSPRLVQDTSHVFETRHILQKKPQKNALVGLVTLVWTRQHISILQRSLFWYGKVTWEYKQCTYSHAAKLHETDCIFIKIGKQFSIVF